ncbi:hypothetical protein [Streptomyces canus]|uniref:hypothetical protein n=1 Tax=Streptomyces canus TaxID=58343 RepID=UPI0027833BC4|nr:hypothetical protein [Streptomyces canus]MDQ0758859.1 hypothetical protein [Streptomyces canus]
MPLSLMIRGGTSDGSAKAPAGVSRRHALSLVGTAGAGAAVTPSLGAGTAKAAPAPHLTADSSGTALDGHTG